MASLMKAVIPMSFLASFCASAQSAYALGPMTAMQISGLVSQPLGHVQFCREHPDACLPDRQPDRIVKLDAPTFQQLSRVNSKVNHDITPMTDMELYGVPDYWTYPTNAGDCEDYALLKEKDLEELGWPDGALLMTVVRDEKGEGHAVLTVRTDHGDIILDNKTDQILVWSATPYQYIKRQSTQDKRQWVGIYDDTTARLASYRQ